MGRGSIDAPHSEFCRESMISSTSRSEHQDNLSEHSNATSTVKQQSSLSRQRSAHNPRSLRCLLLLLACTVIESGSLTGPHPARKLMTTGRRTSPDQTARHTPERPDRDSIRRDKQLPPNSLLPLLPHSVPF